MQLIVENGAKENVVVYSGLVNLFHTNPSAVFYIELNLTAQLQVTLEQTLFSRYLGDATDGSSDTEESVAFRLYRLGWDEGSGVSWSSAVTWSAPVRQRETIGWKHEANIHILSHISCFSCRN